MRVALIVVALLAGALPAAAEEDASAAQRPAIPSPRETYAAMPFVDRVALQCELIWAGAYDGVADGEIAESTIDAIRAFQKDNKSKQTGVLNPKERASLSALAKKERDSVGWRIVDDARSGSRVGIPGKLVPQASRGKTGSRWSAAHGEAVIETFRIKETEATLAAVFEQEKKEPGDRKIESSSLQSDSFVISGLQGTKRFYVRAQWQDDEIRGLTVLYDQSAERTMGKLVRTMWGAFMPFSPPELAVAAKLPSAKGRVDYGTGIVVSTQGHIVVPRHLADDCRVLVVPQLGHADLLADDPARDLALLRVHGIKDIAPLPLAGEPAAGPSLTLVGIADPQAQRGGAAVSTANARVRSSSNGLPAVDPVPLPGFSGAAAIDGKNQVTGIVQVKPQLLAGAAPANLPPPATMIAADTIRSFLEAQAVQPALGDAGVEEAKASVVRVICVRD